MIKYKDDCVNWILSWACICNIQDNLKTTCWVSSLCHTYLSGFGFPIIDCQCGSFLIQMTVPFVQLLLYEYRNVRWRVWLLACFPQHHLMSRCGRYKCRSYLLVQMRDIISPELEPLQEWGDHKVQRTEYLVRWVTLIIRETSFDFQLDTQVMVQEICVK